MKKAWLYKRKARPGWYVRWYGADGKQYSKRLPNKALAEQYRARLEHQMNEDLYVDPLSLPWDGLVEAFLEYKGQVKNAAAGTIKSYGDVLANVRRVCGPLRSTQLNQKVLQRYVVARRREGVSPATINKDLTTLRVMVNWAIKQRYMGQEARKIDFGDLRQTVARRPVRALDVEEVARLLQAAWDLYGWPWYIRVVLAISTGLRQGDIEALQVEDLHLEQEQGTVTTRSQKTGKGRGNRPLHPIAAQAIRTYLAQEGRSGPLLADSFHSSKWKRIKKQAGLEPELRFHDLRKSFASFVVSAGHSTAVVQELLEHSTPNLTQAVYVNASSAHRKAVNSVPLDEAVKGLPGIPVPEPAPATSEGRRGDTGCDGPCDTREDPGGDSAKSPRSERAA